MLLEDEAEGQTEGELQIHSERHFWAQCQSLLLQTPRRATRRWDKQLARTARPPHGR